MKKLNTCILLLLFTTKGLQSLAQAGSVDTTFNPTDVGFGLKDGANGTVWTSIQQADGKVLIGGQFNTYNGVSKRCLARINSDGTIDPSFISGSGPNSTVKTIAVQPDGKIVIGGEFTAYNGVNRNHIARLNADGSLDNAFNPSYGAGNYVLTCAVQPDGKILLGGVFTFINDSTRKYIARMNTDGSVDTTFKIGSGFSWYVNTMALQPDGKILVGGIFQSYNGVSRIGLARLLADGTLDMSFNPATEANTNVNVILPQSDGKVIVAGWFNNINATPRKNIARLNSDGTLDVGFNPGSGANDIITSCALQTDDKLLIAGNFTNINGIARKYAARLYSNGSLDMGFDAGANINNYIKQLSVLNDSNILICGDFTIVNGMARGFLAKLKTNGLTDTIFNHPMGANNTVWCHALQVNGKILLGGLFTAYNGSENNALVRLNTDGRIDTTFKSVIVSGGQIVSIHPLSDGRIVVAGWFNIYNLTGKKCLARFLSDGNLDNTFVLGDGSNTTIYASAMQSDGKLIVVGNFDSYNTTSRQNIARIQPDGNVDLSFNPGTGSDNAILTTSLQADGKIIVGGWFNTYNGKTSNRIARIHSNGSFDSTFNTGTGLNDPVDASAVQADGKILIGGRFTSYNGTGVGNLVRLNANGSMDNTFSTGGGAIGGVFKIAVQADGRILLGGTFGSYNGIPGRALVRINSNGTKDISFNVGSGVGGNSGIRDISIQSDGNILIGGTFLSYNGIGRNRIARIIGVCTNNTASAASSTPVVCMKTSIASITHQTTGTNGIGVATGLPEGLNAIWFSNTITISGAPKQSGVFNYSIPLNGGCSTVFATGTITVNAIDTGISITGNVLKAKANVATYQWIDCNNNYTPISGANAQTYTASTAGSYAVIVTQNGCKDTSACLQFSPTGLQLPENSMIVAAYPNPTYGQLAITLNSIYDDAEIVIVNTCGQDVFSKHYRQTDKLSLNFEAPSGVYFLKVKIGTTESKAFKIIKI